MVDENGKVVNETRLSDLYLAVNILTDNEKYNSILRGMMKQEQRMNRAGYTGEVCIYDIKYYDCIF